MKFLNYLQEASVEPAPPFSPEQAAILIRKNCKPFLTRAKGAGFLWRGTWDKDLNLIEVIKTRKDRLPMNMNERIHKALNEAFKKKFGWKVRSEGVFCTGKRDQATDYGNARLVFPIGEFKFVWSADVEDLLNFIPHEEYRYIWPKMSVKDLLNDKMFKEMIEMYTDNNLAGAIKWGNEISIKCKQYYSVHNDWARHIAIRELIK